MDSLDNLSVTGPSVYMCFVCGVPLSGETKEIKPHVYKLYRYCRDCFQIVYTADQQKTAFNFPPYVPPTVPVPYSPYKIEPWAGPYKMITWGKDTRVVPVNEQRCPVCGGEHGIVCSSDSTLPITGLPIAINACAQADWQDRTYNWCGTLEAELRTNAH